MATKWKNITPSLKRFILGQGGKILISVITLSASFIVFFNLLVYRHSFNTESALVRGLLANILLSIAVTLGIKIVLQRIYQDWLPSGEDFYSAWKATWKKQQTVLILVFVFCLLFALFYFNNMLITSYGYYSTNYATGYILIFTVLLQFGISELFIISHMHRLLDLTMDKIVEQKQASVNTAVRSEQMKVDLISNVSHDLKTPLTSMVGYIELMKKEELTDTLRDYTEVLSIKAQKLKEMIDSLFSLAKTSSGNIELKLEPINLNRLVEQIYADLEDQIDRSGLVFVTELTAQDTELISDSSYMYRICQNLLENALKYSAAGTRVFLKTSVSKTNTTQTICFEITNTAGYPMNFTKEQVVERFARGDEARTSDGNGLGLAIVSTYTSALGGSFDVNIDCDQFKAIIEFEKKQ